MGGASLQAFRCQSPGPGGGGCGGVLANGCPCSGSGWAGGSPCRDSSLTLSPPSLAEAPRAVEVPAPLAARVVLPCTPRSAWATCEWQRPFPEAAPCVLRDDGLELMVTEGALGEYTCRCAEAGVKGLVASYRLVKAAWAGPSASRSAERSYSVLVGIFCFVLGVVVSSGCLLLHERRRRERLQRELICRERNGLDLMQSTTTSCSHEPQTPSSPEDERHPLATAKKNGSLNGYPHLYINELDTEQARIYLTGVPLAKCDETSI